jgi:competence CoiA-like predicted nuclease
VETCLYNGRQICAYDVTNLNYALNYELKKEWKIAGKYGELICEKCGQEVQLRVNDPRQRTPHFSHKITDNKCPFTNNDFRESEDHKKGKMLLYHYFKDKYPDVKPMLNHRFSNRRKADLYIEFNNGDKLAVEYQRTELDILEWQERQDEYTKEGINVIWLIAGKEADLKVKEKQVEVTFFQQIMLNELDKVAVFLDINSSKLIFAKNMRYSDPYIINNDFEDLYIKSYNLNDVIIHTNGKIECGFNDEYNKAIKIFNDYYAEKCLNEEKHRQRLKEEEIKSREQLQKIENDKIKSHQSFREIKLDVEQQEDTNKYFNGNISYKTKLKNAMNGDESAIKATARHFIEWGCSNDYKIITFICRYHYLNGNKKVKEVYEKIMTEAGFASEDLEVKDGLKHLECPFCKGKLNQKYGKYGSFVSCSNYPECKFSFN